MLWRTSHKKLKREHSVNCVAIDRNDNNRAVHPAPHTRKPSGAVLCVQRTTDSTWWTTDIIRSGEGDIVICNQGVLHGEEPEQVRQIRSYSVALTGVQCRGAAAQLV